ncbi:probable methyltransferase-like protein 25 [Battus philenor]|uniref:probable methyltransferase-like protein 25 n=1 Tax=Battus philenor TaxID=42288 RepID=UPI0035CEC7A3
METRISRIHQHLDRILKYLNPLMPLANCHMVEFLTENHWDRLLPYNLRNVLDKWDLDYGIDKFWTYASERNKNDNCELGKWIHMARSLYLTVNNDYCLSTEELQKHIHCWGGIVPPEIKVKEFMTSKKSYEVQRMSRLVAALHNASGSTHCLEAGGGRGHLLVALTLGYNIPSLTLDCDEKALKNATERVKIIQKQWRAIAKKITNGNEESVNSNINCNIHRFATEFVTKNTDMSAVIRDSFPEHSDEDIRVLLTGLHTCGNLGPDSLRIFTTQSSTAGLFNVPCCYHLLSEELDVGFFDVFQRDYGCGADSPYGFPMSEYLRGYNLGRNARMLAAQSIDRVVHQRQLPSKSFLYRALFQVIVKKHLPECNLSNAKLKKIALNCDNFKQYFKMADHILSLGLYGTISDNILTDVSNDLKCQWKQIVMFYLLRLCLAQVIECLLLLDRLLYLLENGFGKAYLVKLFDPVLSPRCHSIVAIR